MANYETTIRTEADFNKRCFEEFGLQPSEAIAKTPYGSADKVENWAEAFQIVEESMRS